MGATSRRNVTLGVSAAPAMLARSRYRTGRTDHRLLWSVRSRPSSGFATDDKMRSSVPLRSWLTLIRSSTGGPPAHVKRNRTRDDQFVAIVGLQPATDVQIIPPRFSGFGCGHDKRARRRAAVRHSRRLLIGLHIDHADVLGADYVHAHLRGRRSTPAHGPLVGVLVPHPFLHRFETGLPYFERG